MAGRCADPSRPDFGPHDISGGRSCCPARACGSNAIIQKKSFLPLFVLNLFASKKIRSLVVVVSEKERGKFLTLCGEENVNAVSYGNGVPAKEVVARFRDGEGDVLVGTAAHFGEGIDLPRRVAPVIFFLRPAYPRPNDPVTVFEERRFGNKRWLLWNWRVMIEALQVRGRNIRSAEDVGVTFFISQQFRRFLFAALPQWLEPAYRGDSTFDECVEETMKLLEK